MINTGLILHLLTLAEHHLHGRHFHPFTWVGCYQTVKVAGTHPQMYRLVCGTIRVWQHGATVRWG